MRLLLCLMTLTFMVGAKIEHLMFAQAAAQEDSKRAAARSFNSEAERLRKLGTAESLRKAIVKYEEALLLWRSAGDKSGEAETLTSAAQVYNSLGDKQRALAYFQRAIDLWKEAPDGKGQAIALSGVGAVY